MEKFEFADFKIDELVEENHYGKFIIEPLERGFGTTIGNALRRVLLSSLPGGAVYSMKIEGYFHEYQAIPGVREDITTITLGLKDLILKISGDEEYSLRINKTGGGKVTAGEIECPTGVEILNPELVIATLEDNGKLDMELMVKNGRGYVSADENKILFAGSSQAIGTIYTDSIYTPIERVSYNVEQTRVGQDAKYDRLVMEVFTNGSITPQESVALASKVLVDHFSLLLEVDKITENLESVIAEPELEEVNKLSLMMLEDLDLSVRSYNCLKRASIQTVEELVNKTEDELMKVRNLGKKSFKEVKDKVEELGLSFRQAD
ncbi:MAG: DNA-directed RNA polymerase subunit alpha [Erysipelothrix sp.]|nr:DNA-directed RNA polymerase subunit alpha [Erysipelothrix sp.]